MKAVRLCFIAFATIVSIVCGAPTNTEKIDGILGQLNCASNAIYQIAGKYDLGDLWFDVYFPIVMHTNTIYGCQDEKTQESSDECVNEEIQRVDLTLIEFLQNLRKNNTQASEEVYDAITLQCNFELPALREIDLMPEIEFNRIQFKKFINIEHIKCVIKAIASGIVNSELAKEWIVYNVELTENIAKMVLCRNLVATKRNFCYVTEAQNIARVLIKFWKFLSQKKHVEMIRDIKGVVQERCYSQVLLL